jgi:hypothetical protein
MDLHAAVEKARQKQAEALAPSTVDLPLPIFGGRAFYARFGVLDEGRADAYNDRIEAAGDVASTVEIIAAYLAESCRCIVVPSDDGPQVVTDSMGEVGFDERFAEAVGLELDEQSSEAVVRAIWRTRDGTLNATALDEFASILRGWMSNTNARVQGSLVGESAGGAS